MSTLKKKPPPQVLSVLLACFVAGCCSKGGEAIEQPTCAMSCHGDATTEAPPSDTLGNTETTARGVGAHRAHLGQGKLGRAALCEECHTVPQSANAKGHYDTTSPAELTFGGVALNRGAAPSFEGDTCNNTYCHNPTSSVGSSMGGSLTAPTWTKVDGSQISCSSCHAMPPPYDEEEGGHPSIEEGKACGYCHTHVDKINQTVFLKPELHVNGEVEVF